MSNWQHRLIFCVPVGVIALLAIAYVQANVEFRAAVAACHRQGGQWTSYCLLPGQAK